MVLREVLKQVVAKLGLEKTIPIEDKVIRGDDIDRLLVVSNNIIRELASSYMPLLNRERVRVEDNRLDLTKLERPVIKVVSLRAGNQSVRFKMYPTYMYARNGIFDIVYSYLPAIIGIDDEVEVDRRVNEDILANGIMSEYAMMIGDVDKASYYDRRYREALKNLTITTREIRIKGRAFI